MGSRGRRPPADGPTISVSVTLVGRIDLDLDRLDRLTGAAGAVALDDGAGGWVGWRFHEPGPYRNRASVSRGVLLTAYLGTPHTDSKVALDDGAGGGGRSEVP